MPPAKTTQEQNRSLKGKLRAENSLVFGLIPAAEWDAGYGRVPLAARVPEAVIARHQPGRRPRGDGKPTDEHLRESNAASQSFR